MAAAASTGRPRVNKYFKILEYFKLFRKIEKWIINKDEIKKELIDFELDGYHNYPELFFVNDNFCYE